jgi:uncharacterized protein YeaO (DUF488 family)
MIHLKRVYDKRELQDGTRFLVERLWPRGLRKADVHMDGWQKEAGPSDQLRKWFSHDPEKWAEFQRKYSSELEKRTEAWGPILKAAEHNTITLLYSSHNTEHCNAVALKHFLEAKPAHGSTTKAHHQEAKYDGNEVHGRARTGA